MIRRFLFEARLLLRSRLVIAALAAMALATTLALILGWSAIVERQAAIARAIDLQASQHAAYLRTHALKLPDAGQIAYDTFFVVPDPPGPLAWLSLGARETRPAVTRVRMLGLEGQIHDGEARNPEQLAAGAFDFGFVVVFLLPLLCIALCHDLASQDREHGRSALVMSLVVAPRRFWLSRVATRLVLVCAAVLVPLLIVALVVDAWHLAVVWVMLAVVAYAALWIALSAWVALRWRRRGSAAQAATQLALWATLTLALPAFAAAVVAVVTPAPASGEIVLAHRQKVNDAWDLPKQTTFDAFFRWHPEWRSTPPVTGRFHWKWYYAFHHVADRHVTPMTQAADDTVRRRQRIGDRLALVLPSMALQRVIDDLADNGTERLFAHRAAVRDFHNRLRLSVYPFVFEERPMTTADFAALPKPTPTPSVPQHAVTGWLCLALGLFCLLVALIRETGRNVHIKFLGSNRDPTPLPLAEETGGQPGLSR